MTSAAPAEPGAVVVTAGVDPRLSAVAPTSAAPGMFPRKRQGSLLRAIATDRRDQAVLIFIAGYLEVHDGIAPATHEIVSAGVAPRPSAVRAIASLLQRGWLRGLARRVRAIEPARPVPLPRAPDGAAMFFIPLERIADHG